MNDGQASDSYRRNVIGKLAPVILLGLLLFAWPLAGVIAENETTSQPATGSFDYHCEKRACQFWLTDPSLMLRSGLRFQWDFGDGQGSTAAAPVHQYEYDGRFEPALTVFDAFDEQILVSSSAVILGFDPESAVNEFGAVFNGRGGALTGFSAADLGDFNANGLRDLVIGSPDYLFQGAGEAHVVFGRPIDPGMSFELQDLDGSDGFIFVAGDSNLSGVGFSSAGIGSITPDAARAALIGAPGIIASQSGETEGIPVGGAGHVVALLGSGNEFPAQITGTELDGSNGFVLAGIFDEGFGASVASAGDFIDNGLQDIVIGAPLGPVIQTDFGPQQTGRGRIYVVYGRQDGFPPSFDIANMTGGDGFVLEGEFDGDGAGWSVDGIGDFNGNGSSDIVIGAPFFQDPDQIDSTIEGVGPEGIVAPATAPGTAYVVFGGQDPTFEGPRRLDDDLLNGFDGFAIRTGSNDMIGWSVAGVGDLNSNGSVDLAVSAPNAPHPETFVSGAVYVLFGGQGENAFGAEFNPATGLNGSNGFAVTGLFQGVDGDFQGDRTISLASAGDVNGNGFSDLLIGGPGLDLGAGAAYVIFGRNDGFPAVIDVTALDPEDGFMIVPSESGMAFGKSVAGLGDFDGDGVHDVVVGQPGNSDTSGAGWVIPGQVSASEPLINDGQGIDDQVVFAGQVLEIDFTVSDVLDPPAQIVVTASSQTPTLIPPDGVSVLGADANRTLRIETVLGFGGLGQVNVEATNSFGLTTVEEVFINIDPTPAPIINDGAGIPDQEMTAGETLAIAFTVDDPEFEPDAVEVIAQSGNPSVLPSDQLSIQGEGTTRNLLIESFPSNVGATEITLEARNPLDGTDTVVFNLTITAAPPRINDGEPIDDAEIQAGDALEVDFQVDDPLDPAGTLDIAIESSNPELIPVEAITVVGTGNERSLVIETQPGTQGQSVITVTVTNTNGEQDIREFVVEVFLLPTELDLAAEPFVLPGFPDLLVRLSAANIDEETAFGVLMAADIPEPFEVIGVFIEAQGCLVESGVVSCDEEALPAWECSLFEESLVCVLESLEAEREAGVVLRVQGAGQAEMIALLEALNAPQVEAELELDF